MIYLRRGLRSSDECSGWVRRYLDLASGLSMRKRTPELEVSHWASFSKRTSGMTTGMRGIWNWLWLGKKRGLSFWRSRWARWCWVWVLEKV